MDCFGAHLPVVSHVSVLAPLGDGGVWHAHEFDSGDYTLHRDDRGQDLIEYGLLTGFVSLIVVLTVTNLGQALDGIYSGVAADLP